MSLKIYVIFKNAFEVSSLFLQLLKHEVKFNSIVLGKHHLSLEHLENIDLYITIHQSWIEFQSK